MPGNNSSAVVHYWAGKYGNIAWLFGPGSLKKCKLRPWLPYAFDCDAFSAWQNQTDWDEQAFFDALDYLRLHYLKPSWVVCPDVVTNKKATLEKWDKYRDRVATYGWPVAFVVQDGMTPEDVPSNADLVFVGGSRSWKWRTVNTWADNFDRVHVGRVNSIDRVWLCHDLGVESVDGTGWFRDGDDSPRLMRIESYLKGDRPPRSMDMFPATIAAKLNGGGYTDERTGESRCR